MQITKEIVEYVGHLSRIELDEQEKQILSIQLTGILNFIDKLKTPDVDKVKPTSHILDVNNIVVSTEKVETTEGLLRGLRAVPLKGDSPDILVGAPEGRSPYGISSHWGFSGRTILREDKPTVSLTNASALENAPVKQGNLFVVPKIIE